MASRSKTELKGYFNTGDIPTAQNFSDLIDSALGIPSGSAIGVESDQAILFGTATTNGSWRLIRSGDNLSIQRRESDAWVEKTSITAS